MILRHKSILQGRGCSLFIGLIVLVTMTTPVSRHVKDKNNIFTARGEDMIFLEKEQSSYFISIYIIKDSVHYARLRFQILHTCVSTNGYT